MEAEEQECDYCGRAHFGTGSFCGSRCESFAKDDEAGSDPDDDELT
jgi:hypothetical protein